MSLGMQACGYEPVLVEPGLHGARNAQQRGLMNIVCSTLEDAEFTQHSLPAIGIFDVLEHIAEDHKFLDKLRNVLSRSGRLYVSVPTYGFLWSVDDVFAGHARRYTKTSLIRDVERAGFDVEYCTYFFSPLPLPIFLARTLPSFLSIRNETNSGGGAHEHVSSKRSGRIMRAVFDWELRAIAARRSIPVGSSCLLVAKPK